MKTLIIIINILLIINFYKWNKKEVSEVSFGSTLLVILLGIEVLATAIGLIIKYLP